MKSTFFYGFVTLFAISCQSAPEQQNTSETSAIALKPVDQLGYFDIVNAVVSGQGEGLEYHGEPLAQEAAGDLRLEEREPCGENNCGKAVYLINQGEKSVQAILYAPFKVEALERYTARKLTLQAGQAVNVSCSHFCYAGKAYTFQWKVAGAEYANAQ